MGIYVYGVSSQSRKIKGFERPVYDIRFIGKDTFSTSAPGHRLQRIKSRYHDKPSMLGELVAYDLFDDSPEYIPVYEYKRTSNTFSDAAIDYPNSVMKPAGFAKRVGKRLVRVTVMEYIQAMNKLQEHVSAVEFRMADGEII